jgi:osmotically-inducible protein OsmY
MSTFRRTFDMRFPTVCALAAVVSVGPAFAEQYMDADNTGKNVRDRGDTVTPTDQGNATADVETTAKIRKGIVDDDSRKMRSPRKAQQVAGVKRVDDQLEIERK